MGNGHISLCDCNRVLSVGGLKDPEYQPSPWGGCYVGVNAGHLWARDGHVNKTVVKTYERELPFSGDFRFMMPGDVGLPKSEARSERPRTSVSAPSRLAAMPRSCRATRRRTSPPAGIMSWGKKWRFLPRISAPLSLRANRSRRPARSDDAIQKLILRWLDCFGPSDLAMTLPRLLCAQRKSGARRRRLSEFGGMQDLTGVVT